MTDALFQDYIRDHAPILYFKLDPKGAFLEMNAFARQVVGDTPSCFGDIVLDFASTFDLKAMVASGADPRLLNIRTASGRPASFCFLFRSEGTTIRVLGHTDMEEVDMMRAQFLDLNRELGNLNRELSKKNAQLKQALDHVKTLQGIIPICMHCHKIRNDDQIWDRLELYLSEHTDARLSHGICPDCMETYYSEGD